MNRILPSGRLTYLFTDLEESTVQWEKFPDAMRSALVRHDELIEVLVKENSGTVVRPRGEGDSRFAVFQNASNAVAAAGIIQQKLHTESWPDPLTMRVRISLHTGEAELRAGDYYGTDVNLCARIRGIAHGGQTLLSSVTAELVRPNLPRGVNLKDLGVHRLKGLSQPEQIFQLNIPNIPSDFPPLKSLPGNFQKAPPSFLDADAEQFDIENPVFVGREEELLRLDRYLNKALSGQGNVALVKGEAGQGKTSLVREFAHRAQKAYPNLVVAKGNCNAYSGIGEPFLPFREILGMLTGDVEARWAAGAITRHHALRLWSLIPEAANALVTHGPNLVDNFIAGFPLIERAELHSPEGAIWLDQLRELVDRKAGETNKLTLEQYRFFDEYNDLLRTLASKAPILLIIEDLHWADISSISLLFHLGRRTHLSQVFIIGTFRPEDIPSRRGGEINTIGDIVSELKRLFGNITIDLGQAQAIDSQGFVGALVDSEPNRLGDPFREELAHRTGGHALFTVELLNDLQEQGGLLKDEEGFWVESPNLNWNILPARIEGVIEKRFSRLDAALYRALTIASVEGEEFTAEMIANIAGIDERELIRKLSIELGKQHRMVSAQEVHWVNDRRLSVYKFRHNLFQLFLYNSLDEAEKNYLHEDVGNALEKLYPGRTGEIAVRLAGHFTKAGILEKAIHYLRLSGEQAIQRSAFEAAIDHLSQGIELIQRLSISRKVARQEVILQSYLGSVYQATKGYAAREAEHSFKRALELCDEWKLIARKFPVLLGLIGVYSARLNIRKAYEVARQALDIAIKLRGTSFLTTGYLLVGASLFDMGQLVASRRHIELALENYTPDQIWISAAFHPLAGSYRWLSLVHHLSGYPDKAQKVAENALSLFQATDDFHSLTVSHYTLSQLFSLKRDYGETRNWAETAIEISKKYGFPYWLEFVRYLRGWTTAHLIDPKEGIAQIKQIESGEESEGYKNPYGLVYLADAYLKSGQAETGLKLVQDALAIIEKTGQRVFEAEFHRLKGEFLIQLGADSSTIEKRFRFAIEIARKQDAKWWEQRATHGLARFLISQGRMDEARGQLSEIYGWFKEGFDTVDLRDAKKILDETHENIN